MVQINKFKKKNNKNETTTDTNIIILCRNSEIKITMRKIAKYKQIFVCFIYTTSTYNNNANIYS